MLLLSLVPLLLLVTVDRLLPHTRTRKIPICYPFPYIQNMLPRDTTELLVVMVVGISRWGRAKTLSQPETTLCKSSGLQGLRSTRLFTLRASTCEYLRSIDGACTITRAIPCLCRCISVSLPLCASVCVRCIFRCIFRFHFPFNVDIFLSFFQSLYFK